MGVPKHIKEHIQMGLATGGGGRFFTVGEGGNYSSLTQAMQANTGRGMEIRATVNKAVSAIGSILIGTGTDWLKDTGSLPRGAENGAIGDLISVDGGAWKKIKAISSDTAMVLFQNGTSGSSFRLARLTPITFMLLPGEYAESLIPLEPGFNIIGMDRDACILSEITSDGPLDSYGENFLANFTLGATLTWGAFDSIASISPYANLWDGAAFVMQHMKIATGNSDGTHAGSAGAWPILKNGQTIYDSCEISVHGAFRCALPPVSGTASATRAIFKNCLMQNKVGIENAIVEPSLIIAPPFATLDIIGCQMLWTDFGQSASSGSLSPIKVGTSLLGASTDAVINIATTQMDFAGVEYGIDGLTAGAIINIDNSRLSCSRGSGDLSALRANGASFNVYNTNILGTGGANTQVGVRCSNAGSTVNLRGATRVEGSDNSLVQTAGTINKGSFCTSIGPQSGTITALDT